MRAIHHRLRERRLVALVVAVAPVADEVDQEVLAEPRPVFPRQPRRLETRGRVVGVDVDDGDLEAARQAAGVAGAVRLAGRGGEAELVVGDDVDRAVGVVAVEPRQVERFGHDALARERRVAVDQHRQRHRAVEDRRAGAVGQRARGAGHAGDHRVHRFEMARVRRHRHPHVARRRGGGGARVVLHVAHPAEIEPQHLHRDRILELGQDLRVRLAAGCAPAR